MNPNKPSQKSIVSMALGIAGLALCWFYGVGLVLGIVAVVLSGSGRDGSHRSEGFCKAGKITGILAIVFGAIFLVLIIAGIGFLANYNRYY